jgi:hypothetical protein
MREMNLIDAKNPRSNRDRMKVIKTRFSSKTRSEDEIIMLMMSSRNRFRKSVETGRIEIVSKYEWTLH